VIPFNDLKAHVRAIRRELDDAVARVLDSGTFVLGPEVAALEGELSSRFGAHAVTVGNGTEALQLALEVLAVGPGDEVVTSPLSAAFTALAVQRCGARAVFADLDPLTLNCSPRAVGAAITERTKALLPVHLYGHPADLDPLSELAAAHKIPLIEDACQAHGALYKGRQVGALSGIGALSFYPTKNLGAFGDGGAVLTGDARQAERLKQLRNGGQVDRYSHELPGMNSRLDEIQAAILRVKLQHLDSWNERRRVLAAIYSEKLSSSGLVLPKEEPYARAVYHLFVVRHPRRDLLAARLKEQGVGTLVHYPIPLHLQPVFASWGGRRGDFPIAEEAASQVLSLPLYPEMTDDQAQSVAAIVRRVASSL